MPYILEPTERENALASLREALSTKRVQDLRQAARLWGWQLHGNNKQDVVEQMLGYLGDSAQMSAAFATLPQAEQEMLPWISIIQGRALHEAMQTVLRLATGHVLDDSTVDQHLSDLVARCLVIVGTYTGYTVPLLYAGWLPEIAAPVLVYNGQVEAPSAAGIDTIDTEVEHLLASIETTRPEIQRPKTGLNGLKGNPYQQGGLVVLPRPRLLAPEVLSRWGFTTAAEQERAGFLVELLLNADLCRIDSTPTGRLTVSQASMSAWQDFTLAERHTRMIEAWMMQRARPGMPPQPGPGWHELDLALRMSTYQLHQSAGWGVTRDPLEHTAAVLRAWLLTWLQALPANTWYSYHGFCDLLYHVQPDLLRWSPIGTAWTWYHDDERIDLSHMGFQVWMATYGTMVQAWLAGPASWLGLVQVATEHGRIAAFLRPGVLQGEEMADLPADTLEFLDDHAIRLRNLWQAGSLRPIVRRIAAEETRTREMTLYRIDAAAFRETLRAGIDAGQVSQSFAEAGFPLPAAVQRMLQQWQEHAGRHQIYDNLAVIEFSDDRTLEELMATTRLGQQGGQSAYYLSPRCLVILDPQSVPGLLEELRRKGYTPQVVSPARSRVRPHDHSSTATSDRRFPCE